MMATSSEVKRVEWTFNGSSHSYFANADDLGSVVNGAPLESVCGVPGLFASRAKERKLD